MKHVFPRLAPLAAPLLVALTLSACVAGDPGAQMGAAILGTAVGGVTGNPALSAAAQTAAGAGSLQSSYANRFNGMSCAAIKAEVDAGSGGFINPLAASGQVAYVQAGREVMRAKGC